MFQLISRGSFKNLERFIKRAMKKDIYAQLDAYAQAGVDALRSATPVDSGITSASWSYEIDDSRGRYTIAWKNSNINKGVPIAIILQFGHGTGTGGYVAGRDYINPAIKPTFDKISEKVWQAVKD